MRRNRRTGNERFVVQRNDPDLRPVRPKGAKGGGLGCAERRGVENHVVIVVVLPESFDPGRVGRIRVGKGSDANEDPN